MTRPSKQSLVTASPLPHALRGKFASLGGDQEAGFEQAFATLAYQAISDKAPRLLDKLVGFQLVERNEDNTKAVGVFGFKAGPKWLYVPVFFLNGELKGHELLRVKDWNQFVPLKENWVNYLTRHDPNVLGQREPKTLRELGVLQPDLDSLAVPPDQSKTASARVKLPPGLADWAIPMLPDLFKSASTNPFAGDNRLLVPKLLRESLPLCKAAMTIRKNYPDIAEAMDRFYGPDLLRDSLLALRKQAGDDHAKQAGLLDSDKREPATEFSVLHGRRPRKKTAAEKLEILTDDKPELDERERERLLRDGYLVRDSRNGEEVSVAYNTQTPFALSNPSETGIYSVLVKPGKFERCLIVTAPRGFFHREPYIVVVRLEGPGYGCYRRQEVFVRQPDEPGEHVKRLRGWVREHKNAPVRRRGVYLAVTATGEGTVPFELDRQLDEERYCAFDAGYVTPRPEWQLDEPLVTEPHDKQVCFNQAPGSHMRLLQACLYIPADAAIVELRPSWSADHEESGTVESDSVEEKPVVEPADIADVQLGLIQKLSSLKLVAAGSEIWINGSRPMTTKRALFELVRRYGFREKAAKLMLGEAQRAQARGKAARFYVKYAQGYPLVLEAPTAPAMPEPAMGVNPAYGGVPQLTSSEWNLPVDGLQAGNTDPSVYDTSPEAMPDPMAVQRAQQASQQGQKEVFDTALLDSLVRSVRPDAQTSRYMSDLMKALDRLGRLLFLVYWHGDAFSERYGQADMPELEDSLRNTFEALGDLVLYLKERTVGPMPGAEFGEPQIDEVSD